jgi:hypothetical protein
MEAPMKNVVINYLVAALVTALLFVPTFGNLHVFVNSVQESPLIWTVLLLVTLNVMAFVVFVIREVLDRSDD